MNIDSKRTGNDLVLTITAGKTDLEPTVRSTYNRLRSKVEAKGFRPGKAPDNIIERELGAGTVQAEVIDNASEKLYRHALESEKIRPISRPHVEVKKFIPYTELELVFKLELMPEVTLGDYKKIKKTAPDAKVEEEEVNGVIESLQLRLAKRKQTTDTAKNGDEVVIDFHGRKAGKDVPGAQADDYSLVIGSGKFIPGFEEKLVGHKSGDELSFKIKFPSHYHEQSLAGQEVEFSVKVKSVFKLDLPKVDDEFAKNAGPFTNLENLKDDVRSHLKSEKQQSLQRQLETDVVEAVVDQAKLDLPVSMVEEEKVRIEADISSRLQEQGLGMQEYLDSLGQTSKDFDKQLKKSAETRVKTALVLTEVANKEKLEVTPDELEVRLQVLAGQYKDEKIQQELQRPEVRKELSSQMLAEKTVSKLLEYATRNT